MKPIKSDKLPKGHVEIAGKCIDCKRQFSAFSQIGGEIPYRCSKCAGKGLDNNQAGVVK